MSSWVCKERIGLPIWDGERSVGIKHFMPGATITKEDFEEARQDEDQTAMLVHYNAMTHEQYEAQQRIKEIADELAALQRGADSMAEYDLDSLTIKVADEHAEAFESIRAQVKKLQEERAKLQEVVDEQS